MERRSNNKHTQLTLLSSCRYIVYTSDNGYHLGQFGIPIDKRQP
jgi:hypothetical protein